MSRFRYCLNGSTIRTTPILRQIEAAGRAGYGAIELWHDKIDEHLAGGGTLAEIRAALDHWKLEVPTTIYLAGWFDASPAQYPAVLAECRRKMEQGVALGATYAIASPPLGRADYATGAARYRELLEIGLSLGVRPSMEFLGFVEDLKTIEKALEVLTRAGHPAGTTILDPFHISRGGGDVASIRQLRPEQIAICHFNDIPADPPPRTQRDEDRVLPGEGVYDLRGMLDHLAATGYAGWLSLELFRADLWERDHFEVAALGLEKMRGVAE